MYPKVFHYFCGTKMWLIQGPIVDRKIYLSLAWIEEERLFWWFLISKLQGQREKFQGKLTAIPSSSLLLHSPLTLCQSSCVCFFDGYMNSCSACLVPLSEMAAAGGQCEILKVKTCTPKIPAYNGDIVLNNYQEMSRLPPRIYFLDPTWKMNGS